MERPDVTSIFCEVCGIVDSHYDEDQKAHVGSVKHICNQILAEYKHKKRNLSSNRDGVLLFCTAESLTFGDAPVIKQEKNANHKVRIFAKPSQTVKFSFEITNEMRKEDILFVGTQLAHPQPQFLMNDNQYIFGEKPHIIKTKYSLVNEIWVDFNAIDIGQYEMPIIFTFRKLRDKKNVIFVREMVVVVQEEPSTLPHPKNPYSNEDFGRSEVFIRSVDHISHASIFKVHKFLKVILPINLDEEELNKKRISPELREQLRTILISTRAIFDEGITKNNYIMYFHHLLWWEEIVARINLRKYNMSGVTVEYRADETYWLLVPGLAEKRPSLLRGDKVFIRPQDHMVVLFESIIENIKDNYIQLSKIDESFISYYRPTALFDIRFLMSRVPLERMHFATSRVFATQQECRLFPEPNKKMVAVVPIQRFYNSYIKTNEEQKSAVEHIVSKTSGKAPYIVFGPPGTGKTMTIVEAIVQIVLKNPKNRVLVCTDSNMAADHIAVMLLQYNKILNMDHFILRASSQSREWTILPPELMSVSNGTSYESFWSVTNDHASMYHILVTTLLHAAKYNSGKGQSKIKLQMTHLFIDEAAQAMETAALVPITGLLSPKGQLVLAGDPKQLGPVCTSRQASRKGLGISLLERLWTSYWNLYREDDANYITTLVKNFRSHPDILQIPNELFYQEKPLQPQAALDPLSEVSILGLKGGKRAIVFHAVNSKEQRMGNAPSYFNQLELNMLQKYTTALIKVHNTSPKDIGIIAPYIRQVYKMKDWLKLNSYEDVEIGTVESFQGKEKRVILVSTVRANCRLLDYDAKYGLGFLVDDKRFNVALTRAKSKLIIIGNPACLTRDEKWRKYMELCKEYGTYHGQESQQLDRTSSLLVEVAKTRFDRCHLTEALVLAKKAKEDQNRIRKNQ